MSAEPRDCCAQFAEAAADARTAWATERRDLIAWLLFRAPWDSGANAHVLQTMAMKIAAGEDRAAARDGKLDAFRQAANNMLHAATLGREPTPAELMPISVQMIRERDTVIAELRAEVERLRAALNTPEVEDFAKAVVLEAQHQRERWPPGHDDNKTPADWFWLLGWLAGKAVHNPVDAEAGDDSRTKRLHRIIATAAACANWHAQEAAKP